MEQNIKHFSPSSIITYLECPRLFYYRYISRIKLPQKQIHLLFGSGIHEAIEYIYLNKDPYSAFENVFIKDKLLYEEKNLHDEYIKLGHEMIKNYSETHKTLAKMYNLNQGKSEFRVKRKLRNPLTGEESSLPMSGIIDRITDDGKIIEYKTSAKKWSKEAANYKIQTLLYNLWYYTEYGIMPTETLYIVLLKKYKDVRKGGRVGVTYQALSKHCTIDDLASAFDEIEMIIQKINNNEFDRPQGYHPPYCECRRYEEALNFNQ